ncbi:MAG: hypothetical protein K0U84_13505 [Actinomycetia bacterium]|nr:hypothetical protein [Actinomycetes bacterium]
MASRMTRRFDRKLQDEEETEEARRNRIAAQKHCAAPRCPKAGTMSDSTLGGGPWYCRHHFRDPPRNPITDEEVDWLKQRQREDAAANDLLTWAMRTRSAETAQREKVMDAHPSIPPMAKLYGDSENQ